MSDKLVKITTDFSLESSAERHNTIILIRQLWLDKNDDSLKNIVEERTQASSFRNALKLQEQFNEELLRLKEENAVLSSYVDEKTGKIKKRELSNVEKREYSLKYRRVFEQLAFLNKRLDEYRALTAEAAECMSLIREDLQNNDTFHAGLKQASKIYAYSSKVLGNFVAQDFSSFSEQDWQEYKLGGVGGSSIAVITKSVKNNAKSKYEELLNVKAGIVEADDFVPTAAIERGNKWERNILHTYADKHPELNVAVSSLRWVGKKNTKTEFLRARFDGLVLDNNGIPSAIVEVKTGKREDWGSVDEPLTSIPENYIQQAIWYAMNTGLKYAVIVVLLDDVEYREYAIDMSDPRVVEKWRIIEEAVREFWDEVLLRRAQVELYGSEGFTKHVVRNKGFAKTLTVPNFSGLLSAYMGCDVEEAKDVTQDKIAAAKKIHGRSLSPEVRQELFTQLYASCSPVERRKPFVGIDTETTSLSPSEGRIIETAVVVSERFGHEEIIISTLHNIPELSKNGVGAGNTEVHRINERMLDSKTPFEDETFQKELLNVLKSGILVAHNASFEKGWLVTNLHGFAEALDNGEITILDTKRLCSDLMLETLDDTLRSFSEANGVAYEGAHNATTDTVMMIRALNNFQKNLFDNKEVVYVEVSDAERAKAIDMGKYYDEARMK